MATSTIGTSKELVAHSIDKIGQKLNVYRFPEESLSKFRKRVLDVFVYKANSSVVGLTYGATRELGGLVDQIAVINPIAGMMVAPGIRITNVYIEFYSDISNDTLDARFDIRAPFPREDIQILPYLEDLNVWVTASLNWEFHEPISDVWKLSKYLIPQQSFQIHKSRTIHSGFNRLFDNVSPGTVVSTGRLIQTEVFSLAAIVSYGEYYIDYVNNFLYTFEPEPKESAIIHYDTYNDFIYLDWAPVEIQSLVDPEFIESINFLEQSANNVDYEATTFSHELASLILQAYQLDGTFWFAEDLDDVPVDIYESYKLSNVLLEDAETTIFNINKNLRELLREV